MGVRRQAEKGDGGTRHLGVLNLECPQPTLSRALGTPSPWVCHIAMVLNRAPPCPGCSQPQSVSKPWVGHIPTVLFKVSPTPRVPLTPGYPHPQGVPNPWVSPKPPRVPVCGDKVASRCCWLCNHDDAACSAPVPCSSHCSTVAQCKAWAVRCPQGGLRGQGNLSMLEAALCPISSPLPAPFPAVPRAVQEGVNGQPIPAVAF